MASNAHQVPAQKREDIEGYNIPNVIRDGININAPGFEIHEPANGKGGSAIIDGTTYYPKATSAPQKRDGIDINLPNYTIKDGSAVIKGTTYYPRATPQPNKRDGIDINLPNYTIKDGSAVIKGTTYYPRATPQPKRDGIDINLPNYTIKEPANGKGGYAIIKGTTYTQPAARATPAPARRQATPTTTWANGIETIIYDGQTIALPNITISGTETPTSLPAATIGDQTFTFPVVTADPNAPAPTLSLSSVSGIPLPPSVSFTPLAPLSTLTPLGGPPAPSVTPLSNDSVPPPPPADAPADPAVTTLSLSSVSGIPLPPTQATIPGLPVARSSVPVAAGAFKSPVPGVTSAAAATATILPIVERYFSIGPDGTHVGSGSGSSEIISTDNWDRLTTAQRLVIIIVSAVVGVLIIGGITALVLCCRRRRSARSRYEDNRYAAEEGYWKEGAPNPGYGYSQPRPPQQAQPNPFADPRRQ